MVKAVALVSVGRHPSSGRARRAVEDARAVELGYRLFGANLRVVHAGNPHEDALRDYLGMGVTLLTVLPIDATEDAFTVLLRWLKQEQPTIILTGEKSENDDGTGMLPYHLAEALNAVLITNTVDLELVDGSMALAIQALPEAGRRTLEVEFPLIAVVSSSAPSPRQVSNRLRRSGVMEFAAVGEASQREREPGFIERAARRRPKRLKATAANPSAGGSRLMAVMAGSASGGTILKGIPPEEAARALLEFLATEGVLRMQRVGHQGSSGPD